MKNTIRVKLTLHFLNLLYVISFFAIGGFLFNQVFVEQKFIISNSICMIILIITNYFIIVRKEKLLEII